MDAVVSDLARAARTLAVAMMPVAAAAVGALLVAGAVLLALLLMVLLLSVEYDELLEDFGARAADIDDFIMGAQPGGRWSPGQEGEEDGRPRRPSALTRGKCVLVMRVLTGSVARGALGALRALLLRTITTPREPQQQARSSQSQPQQGSQAMPLGVDEAAPSEGDDLSRNGLAAEALSPWQVSTVLVPLLAALQTEDAGAAAKDHLTALGPLTMASAGIEPGEAVLVGTMRMGYGHLRIARALASWCCDNDSRSDANGVASSEAECPGVRPRRSYIFDFLAPSAAFDGPSFNAHVQPAAAGQRGRARGSSDEPEAVRVLRDGERLYSRLSRVASEVGGVIEYMWGTLTAGSYGSDGDDGAGSANPDALRVAALIAAAHLTPLLDGVPRDLPVVATHCLVGLAAVAAGFSKVINLVIDNHAQWFVVVPGALNLVQGPATYHQLLRMGVPPESISLAGHWVPRDMVVNLYTDCELRLARCNACAPLRLLLPVGGAGAQRQFITDLIGHLADGVHAGEVDLVLNAGDHAHMEKAFVDALVASGLVGSQNDLSDAHKQLDLIDTMEGVRDLAQRMRADSARIQQASGRARAEGGDGAEVVASTYARVTLIAFPPGDVTSAVVATDELARVCDLLCCKPSEMAFYPVPKLLLRRVGDHEGDSALRAAELGDGTHECRTARAAAAVVRGACRDRSRSLLRGMNECVQYNAGTNVYSGCEIAAGTAHWWGG